MRCWVAPPRPSLSTSAPLPFAETGRHPSLLIEPRRAPDGTTKPYPSMTGKSLDTADTLGTRLAADAARRRRRGHRIITPLVAIAHGRFWQAAQDDVRSNVRFWGVSSTDRCNIF